MNQDHRLFSWKLETWRSIFFSYRLFSTISLQATTFWRLLKNLRFSIIPIFVMSVCIKSGSIYFSIQFCYYSQSRKRARVIVRRTDKNNVLLMIRLLCNLGKKSTKQSSLDLSCAPINKWRSVEWKEYSYEIT